MSPIIFNGKSYSSVDEMPADVRQAYEQVVGIFADKNRDGIPDILEGALGTGEVNVQSVSFRSDKAQIVVDGKAYSSTDEMPAEVRQKYEQAITEVGRMLKDTDQNDVPDILEGILSAQSIPSASQVAPKPAAATKRPMLETTSPVVTDATPKVGLLLLIGFVIVLLIAVIVGYGVLTLLR